MAELKTAHNVVINGTSPMADILAALTGTWSSTVINNWEVIHLSDRLEFWQLVCKEAGSYMLPRKLDKVALAKIYEYGTGDCKCKLIKLHEQAIKVDQPCVIEVIITNL